ncbi:MAG: aminotransferase class I/II-fold pyridoxal phosphate-dependent enzyme, partial [Anaerovoracaceae bacterium]
MIYKFLKEHAKKQPISFHMPGHKGAALYHKYGYGDFFTDLADLDITEIPGADNLFQAEDIIQSVQEAYRELYQVKASYLLINGTSGGLIAAILATVPRGKKLIMARNCHKSVFNALTLGGIEPVYAYPEEGPVAGPISPQEIEALLKANPDGEAVILPSPNYYGICSDIEAIAKIVHQAGKVLIVDQAHGAHLKFFHRYVKDSVGKLPLAAEDAGADIVVNSIHKTLASFTQSAVLNLTSTRVNPYVLEDKLQAIQSTSPSYLLMASLDINAQLLKDHGGTLMGEWWDLLNHFYAQAKKIPELTVMAEDGMDVTKLNLTLSGYSGLELEKKLMEEN